MNGFHVNAVGWVLTFNAFGLSQREAHELSGLWTALLRARAEDNARALPLLRLLRPRSIPLSGKSLGMFADLMDRMSALRPDRFSCEALRRRRNHWALQVALGFLFGFLASKVFPMVWPAAGRVALMLFTVGCVFLVPTVTLWRAAYAARRFSMDRQRKY
ncbi:MAG TPA: hypothetical protein VEU07_11535, partial [Candidatus Acidoferrum sp.]|nr:hypothetical protein [Candidatus Acidoferrum sp.]